MVCVYVSPLVCLYIYVVIYLLFNRIYRAYKLNVSKSLAELPFLGLCPSLHAFIGIKQYVI
jgi:hypothetical protein